MTNVGLPRDTIRKAGTPNIFYRWSKTPVRTIVLTTAGIAGSGTLLMFDLYFPLLVGFGLSCLGFLFSSAFSVTVDDSTLQLTFGIARKHRRIALVDIESSSVVTHGIDSTNQLRTFMPFNSLFGDRPIYGFPGKTAVELRLRSGERPRIITPTPRHFPRR